MAIVLVLALSTGAAATVLSLLRGLALRPLPVPRPHELVQITTRDHLGREADLTWRQFMELNRDRRIFSATIGSIAQGVFTLQTGEGERRGSVSGVSGNFFGELGATAVIGRLIQPSDLDLASRTAAPVAVLGWTFWQSQFASEPSVVGRTLRIEGVPLTIVGVAPQGFLGLGVTIEADVTVPLTLVPVISEVEAAMFDGSIRWVATTGRLHPGHTLDEARAAVHASWPAIREASAPTHLTGQSRDEYLRLGVEVGSGAYGLERGLRARYTQPLYALLGIATLVLVAAAINLGSLMFARMEARGHEFAVRAALGAPFRLLLLDVAVQTVLLGLAGAVAGLGLARLAGPAIAALLLQDYVVPTSLDVTPDRFVIGVTLLASVCALVTIALLTAAVARPMASSMRIRGALRSVTRSSRIGRLLVASQVAATLVLVAHASLLTRSLERLLAVRSGLTSETVLFATPLQRVGGYRELDAPSYYRRALETVMAVPGVSAAAFTRERPQGGPQTRHGVGRADDADRRGDIVAEVVAVSPGFFATLGLPLLEGRDFSFSDDETGQRVAIVSHDVASRLFGSGRGLGQRLRVGASPTSQNVLVIGVATDAPVFDVRRHNRAIVYTPALQTGTLAHFKSLVVRAPTSVSPLLRQAVESLGVETLPRIHTLAYVRGRAILQERVMAGLGSYFAGLGLVIAAVGVYGLLSYVLSLRRREFGVRLALGAAASQVRSQILAEGLRVTAIGLGAGLVATVATTRMLESVLIAVSPLDPLAIAAACCILTMATLAAAVPPAIRATRVEPLVELRAE